MVKRTKFLFAAILPAFAICAQAQVTTSALSGQVLDNEGQPVVGATVMAVHVPSGTKYGAVTNMDGRYTIQGMRTGGPYKVTFSYVGFNKKEYDGIQLSLGNTFALNSNLEPATHALGEVVVVGSGKQSAGAAQNFSNIKIENTPTVDRNIYDVIKNMPFAQNSSSGLSFAGSNNRYNSFQIDGTVSNDVFGLAGTGTNGGQTGANPIPLDAIQEIQVVVAPFDVRQSGFTGGGINAITKQGTNELHGSAYGYFTNQNMYGRYSAIKGNAKQKLADQNMNTFGGTLSGPIIKDKLFFFVSAENKKETYPNSIYPGYQDGYLTTQEAQQILDKYKEYTGVSDSYANRDVTNKAFSLLGRIDWNINQNNKLAFRYQHNNSYKDVYSPSAYTYTFANSGYKISDKTNSFVAELNSHINNSLYNEARVSATFVRDNRDVPYQAPNVYIKAIDGSRKIAMNLGTDYSSGANSLNQDIYTIEDNLSWYKGNHTLTFGTHNEIYRISNLFIQAANGAWDFDSMDDFLNDNPSRFRYKYTDPTVTGGDTRYAPVMKFGQFGFYAQDNWTINNNLNLTYGLRFDIPVAFNNPTANPAFNTTSDQKGWGVHVGEMPSAKLMVSPRVGFRWYTDDSHNTLVRGGIGMFTGRVPFVWLSNAFNNTGIEAKSTTITKDVPSLKQYAKEPLKAAGTTSAAPDIAVTRKNFKFPQVLRANLAVEQNLPGDVKLTVEGIYSKTLNNVFFQNLALTDEGKKFYVVPNVEASSGTLYTNDKSGYNSIIELKNTNKGYTYALSANLQKHFNFGLDLAASYTFGHAKSVNDGTSSVAYSNWQYNYSRNSNSSGELGYSRFDNPHKINLQVSYTTPKYLNGYMQTTIGFVFNAFSGDRYSLAMYDASGDINNDGSYSTTLLYIPTKSEIGNMNWADTKDKKGNVTMTAAQNQEAFEKWIEGDKYAKNHRGQFAERNSNLTHWQNSIDLHIAQDIYFWKQKGAKVQVTFDVLNFANMLNKKWGYVYSAPYSINPISVTTDKNSGTQSYTFNSGTSSVTKADISSRWHAQVGVRVVF